jgi:GNAT superfamily N-acetyltransferase
MNEPLRFRRAGAADLDIIARLVNSAYRGDSSRAGWTTEADLLDGQRTSAALLATSLPPDSAYLGMVTVDPRRQAGGLGRMLLEQAEAIAHDWNCCRIRMTVIESRQELIAYYVRRGYHSTGKTEPFPADQPEFGLPKVQGLRFVELEKRLD